MKYLFVLVIALVGNPAWASLLTNGSFEQPGASANSIEELPHGETRLTGWSIGGNGASVSYLSGSAVSVVAADGQHHLDFNGGNSAPGGTWIRQTFETLPGTNYLLGFKVARLGSGFGEVSITATVRASGGSKLAVLKALPVAQAYEAKTLNFVATTTSTTVEFLDTSLETSGVDVLLDDVTLLHAPVLPPTPTLLTNGSFEQPGASANSIEELPHGETRLTGWSIGGTGASVSYLSGSAVSVLAADGQHHLDFNGGNNAPGGTWIRQVFETFPGKDYTLGFKVARLGSGFGEVSITATIRASGGNELAIVKGSPVTQAYETKTLNFVAVSTSTTVEFLDTSLVTSGVDVLLDDVTLTAESSGHPNERPPVIVNQPQIQRRHQGTSPTVKVIAVGSQPMTYQWCSNSIPISGATNAILDITDLYQTVGYSVLIANPYGAVLSETVYFVSGVPSGDYNGLFHEVDAVRHQSSGSLRLKLSRSGGFSARLVSAGGTHSLSGRFVDGKFRSTIFAATGAPRTLELELSSEEEHYYVRGAVSGSGWTAPVLADFCWYGVHNPIAKAGKYTFVINPQTSDKGPIGSSFGSVSVTPAGIVRFTGKFADNSLGAQSVRLSAEGQWPLYLPLYRGAGSALGWLTLTNVSDSSFAGEISWIKENKFGTYFSNGFTNSGLLMGSTYLPPTNRTLIHVTNAVVRLSGDIEVENDVLLNPTEARLLGRTNYQVLRLSPSSGLFKGNAIDAESGIQIPIRGAVMQEATNAFGYFLTTNFSGAVKLAPH